MNRKNTRKNKNKQTKNLNLNINNMGGSTLENW